MVRLTVVYECLKCFVQFDGETYDSLTIPETGLKKGGPETAMQAAERILGAGGPMGGRSVPTPLHQCSGYISPSRFFTLRIQEVPDDHTPVVATEPPTATQT